MPPCKARRVARRAGRAPGGAAGSRPSCARRWRSGASPAPPTRRRPQPRLLWRAARKLRAKLGARQCVALRRSGPVERSRGWRGHRSERANRLAFGDPPTGRAAEVRRRRPLHSPCSASTLQATAARPAAVEISALGADLWRVPMSGSNDGIQGARPPMAGGSTSWPMQAADGPEWGSSGWRWR